MKIEFCKKKFLPHVEDGKVRIKYKFQLWDDNDNLIENAPVQVFDNGELICDSDTDIDGEVKVEMIVGIMDDVRKKITFAVGEQRRTAILNLEFLPKLRDKMEEEAEALRLKKEAEEIEKISAKTQLKVQKELKEKKEIKAAARLRTNRIDGCDRFFPHLGIGIVVEDSKTILINEDGELISTNKFDAIVDFKDVPTTVARIGKKYYLMDKKGEILSMWCDEIVIDDRNCWAHVKKGNKYAVFSLTGEILIDWCDKIITTHMNGVFQIKKDYAYYFLLRELKVNLKKLNH